MRQRSKVAAALVTNPLVLVLDEPLNGADPVQRLRLIELFRRLGAEGRTVIVSSHVLHEVESMAERVIVVVRGRLAAAGSRRALRAALNDAPQIGRAACREHMCQHVSSSVVAVSFKKKHKQKHLISRQTFYN